MMRGGMMLVSPGSRVKMSCNWCSSSVRSCCWAGVSSRPFCTSSVGPEIETTEVWRAGRSLSNALAKWCDKAALLFSYTAAGDWISGDPFAPLCRGLASMPAIYKRHWRLAGGHCHQAGIHGTAPANSLLTAALLGPHTRSQTIGLMC